MVSRRERERRRFLERGLACTLLGSGAAAMNGKLGLIGSALAANGDYVGLNDYKALVCVFLYGGADSFNLFVPIEEGRYESYARSRGDRLAVPRGQLQGTSDGVVGFHPNLAGLRNRYDAGDLAVIGNVGNLIRPITREEARGGRGLPRDLFAHDHQQEQVQKGLSSRPMSRVGTGWAGRMADLLDEANAAGALPPTFSLAGSNYLLPGTRTTPVGIGAGGDSPPQMRWVDGQLGDPANAAREATLRRLIDSAGDHPLRRFAGRAHERTLANSRALTELFDSTPPSGLDFSNSGPLGQQLKRVAQLIAGRDVLGMRRQIFFVGMGEWDTHDGQPGRLPNLASTLDAALSTFQDELDAQGVADSVTTFTASDFGRTLSVNGDGTDHGWSGHYLVMGGAVRGGQFVGRWPTYEIGGEDDVSNDAGRMIPTVSVNEYGAALGSWLGLSDSDVRQVFPDLANFGDEWRTRYGLL